MNTDELIKSLAAEAGPVKPLPPLGRRFILWLVVSLLYALFCLFWIGWRTDLRAVATAPGFIWQTLLLAMLTVSSAWLAFVLSIPGRERGHAGKIAVGLVAVAWLTTLLVLILITPDHSPGDGWACSLHITLVGLLPAILLMLMIKRAAPLQWLWAGISVGLAMIALGATALQFACGTDDPMHLLFWHLLPGVFLVLIAAGLASRLFRY